MKPIDKLEPRISIVSLFVRDMQRSYQFYVDGLGFPTKSKPDDAWVGFKLNGLVFCIYPYDNLKEEKLGDRELDVDKAINRKLMPGSGFAYNTREKHQVQEVLNLAEKVGGKIEKQPEDTFWGGYSGYFSDPDGHLWEVAWAEMWQFNQDGSLVL